MLIEIYCDKFRTYNDAPRGRIAFTNGLNVVEGDDRGTNSIGKSTFLMCIDFAFGGNDYIEKLEDVKKNVGDHEICFAFKFDKLYYFSRKTNEPEFVYICDDNYNKTERKVDIDKYTAWLKEQYQIPILDLTFRKIVSRFFRIYNRENLNELLPLRSFDNETEKTSINELIKLFKLYGPIEEIAKKNEIAIERKDTFKKAQSHKFIPSITESNYKENKSKIIELTQQAEELANRSERGILDIDAEKAERIAQLKDQISSLKRTRSRYYNQLKAYERDEQYEVTSLEKDFKGLTDFFNNINLDKIVKFENFHRQMKSLLQKELKTTIKEIWNNIHMLNDAIKELENILSDLQCTTNVSKVVLNSYAAIMKQIEELERINKYHEDKGDIKAEAKKTQKSLDEVTSQQISQLQGKLNSKMAILNHDYYEDETYSPVLEAKPKTYRFFTPDDQGTGCRYKGMLTLDLAILSITDLPVLIHDSVMYGQMSYKRVENTMKLYKTFTKQIFIAVDKTTNLNDEARKIITDNRVLLLAPNGNELFGWYWGKPKEIK